MPTFALTRNGQAIATVEVDAEASRLPTVPFVSESQICGFDVLSSEPDTDYRVIIGDLPASSRDEPGSDATFGSRWGDLVRWRDALHFESARGRVICRLLSRPADGEEEWRQRCSLPVHVVPSKLGERRYRAMSSDLQSLAGSLVADLVSKSTLKLGLTSRLPASASRASHLELRLLERVWRAIAPDLLLLSGQPAVRLERRARVTLLSRSREVGRRAIRQLVTRGVSLGAESGGAREWIRTERLHETTDCAENRIVLGWLRQLESRSQDCLRALDRHVQAIEADRPWRDHRFGEQPSLYESEDRPRLERLIGAREEGKRLLTSIVAARNLECLAGLRPSHAAPGGPLFDHVGPYRRIRHVMLGYLGTSVVLLQEAGEERSKSTSRMYEQWVFIQLVAALRACGLECSQLKGLVEKRGRDRFVLDLDRGTAVTFVSPLGRRVRVRYEPWIFPQAAARDRGETMYRGRTGETAWSPDILVEILALGHVDEVESAVVIDAKYSVRLRDEQYASTSQYLEIRRVRDSAQITRQLWLAHPGEVDGVVPRDPFVRWTENGPDRPIGEVIIGALSLRPDEARADDAPTAEALPVDAMMRFAQGLMRYLRVVSIVGEVAA